MAESWKNREQTKEIFIKTCVTIYI